MDQKPFICSVENCKMGFTNEDHLELHKKKHEMSLILSDEERQLPFVDQTPTPSRFIDHDDRIFPDINPFDEQFRKARIFGELSGEFIEPEPSSNTQQDESLNTPSIPLIIESGVPSIRRSPSPAKTLPSPPKTSSTALTTTSKPSVSTLTASSPSILSAQTSVITSLPKQHQEQPQHQQQQCSSISSSGITSLATTAQTETLLAPNFVSSTTPAAISTPQPLVPIIQVAPTGVPQSGPVYQIFIKLPDSQPSVASPTTLPLPNPPPKITIVNPSNLSKQPISSNNSDKPVNKIRNDVHVTIPSKPPTTMLTSSSPNAIVSSTISSKGRKRKYSEESQSEKRKKFLERNRAAATRCRQRRKQWIENLEQRAEVLATQNELLQSEVTTLREEVAKLKTMLLAHKDCPISQQQKENESQEVSENEPVLLKGPRLTLVPVKLNKPTSLKKQFPPLLSSETHPL